MIDDDGEPLGEAIFAEARHPAERRLALAVILQAIADAGSDSVREAGHRADARRWLAGGGWRYRLICDLAGIDAGWLTERLGRAGKITRKGKA